MSIRGVEFDILLGEVLETLKQVEIPEKLATEATGLLEKYRKFIVEQSLYQRMGGEESNRITNEI